MCGQLQYFSLLPVVHPRARSATSPFPNLYRSVEILTRCKKGRGLRAPDLVARGACAMGKGGRRLADVKPFRLVNSDKILAYRAHNRYILSGHRPDNDTNLVHALFRLHGQSFNIWSHLAGTFIFVIPRVVSDPSIAGAPWLSVALRLHAAIGAACGLASALSLIHI